ncbi:hypothetical protein QCD60_02610 [Pokkaliibacter sp. MBI-7]|uniref:hypothetical protein n=1 Tax=Pokkaliibacter sp. MBI-7 TaxID=3040600 RepID=UPI00244B8603|nr:hypothetical protein [Pokkaliibacter sp. MBI-7]MDH2431449.1 hypothetical protein [Pokkaliibacter sp. MBI-7]
MFSCFSGASGSHSVTNHNVSLSDQHDARLHSLPTGQRNGQVVQVSAATFDRMALAHSILQKTAYDTFPDGPGNQAANVWMSGGRSWMRKEMCRDQVDERASQSQQMAAIKKTGGGNCGEYANTVMAELQRHPRDVPVFKVLESNEHSLVVMGDWRDRTTGDQAVVVDPWQGLPKVHTYGERINTSTPLRTATQEAGSAIRPQGQLKAAFALKPLSSSGVDAEINNHTQFSRGGPAYAKHILREKEHLMFDRISGAQNLHTVYRDPNGREATFNSMPPDYLEQYLDARSAIVKEYR